MFENALTVRNVSTNARITYKTLITAGLISLSVILPQIVHLLLGAPGGVKWLPMYLPVLIAGCLLGTKWGLSVGLLSPLVSFLVTSALGEPMPMLARLPFMMFELAVFSFISGLFSNKMSKSGIWAFPAVILAQICGRGSFLLLITITQGVTQFTTKMIWSQIQTGFIGLLLQAILVPLIIICLRKILIKENENV